MSSIIIHDLHDYDSVTRFIADYIADGCPSPPVTKTYSGLFTISIAKNCDKKTEIFKELRKLSMLELKYIVKYCSINNCSRKLEFGMCIYIIDQIMLSTEMLNRLDKIEKNTAMIDDFRKMFEDYKSI